MTHKTEKALFLLGGLSDDDLSWIINKAKIEKLPPGERLIYEGRPINALYFVLSGLLTVVIGSKEDRELAQITTGEVVGEVSFIDSRPPLATVKALETTQVLAISRFELNSKLHHDSKFAARFYHGLSLCLASRMRGTIRRLGYDDLTEYEIDVLEPEEFSEQTKEFLVLAQAKFNWLVQNLRARE
ncbi:cyclic nucleotide-binding domain-containing protein [Planktothrix sp. FACHB-1365]|uniref:cyclic nucleotide-binding domain-containing protein n=1 Tax=Planktothrix sp. FACHB-1365 TaxID=2692855 RepID=UPI0016858D29|nr:cyclic nucleotide-binding domain-containing protein [Planktothrix sp. FACHB-1365]MBD2482831.1 cyclic nucleotide-binding domain-containing protein [Planktothrix sp. FACHB-1365]